MYIILYECLIIFRKKTYRLLRFQLQNIGSSNENIPSALQTALWNDMCICSAQGGGRHCS